MRIQRIIRADAERGRALRRAYNQYIRYCLRNNNYDEIGGQRLILRRRRPAI